MNEITAFLLFGLLCGVIFGAADTFDKLVGNKAIVFIADMLSVIICTLAFFCLYIGYLDGRVRFYCLVLILLPMLAYLLTVHKKVLKSACKLKCRYNIIVYRRKRKKGDKSESESRQSVE